MNKFTRRLAQFKIYTTEYMTQITDRAGLLYSGAPMGYQVLDTPDDRIWIRWDGSVWSWSSRYLNVGEVISDFRET